MRKSAARMQTGSELVGGGLWPERIHRARLPVLVNAGKLGFDITQSFQSRVPELATRKSPVLADWKVCAT